MAESLPVEEARVSLGLPDSYNLATDDEGLALEGERYKELWNITVDAAASRIEKEVKEDVEPNVVVSLNGGLPLMTDVLQRLREKGITLDKLNLYFTQSREDERRVYRLNLKEDNDNDGKELWQNVDEVRSDNPTIYVDDLVDRGNELELLSSVFQSGDIHAYVPIIKGENPEGDGPYGSSTIQSVQDKMKGKVVRFNEIQSDEANSETQFSVGRAVNINYGTVAQNKWLYSGFGMDSDKRPDYITKQRDMKVEVLERLASFVAWRNGELEEEDFEQYVSALERNSIIYERKSIGLFYSMLSIEDTQRNDEYEDALTIAYSFLSSVSRGNTLVGFKTRQY